MVTRNSYYKPLLVHVLKQKDEGWGRQRAFKYEAYWALEEDCEVVLKEAWKEKEDEGIQASSMVGLLQRSGAASQRWSRKRKRGQ